MTRNGILLLWLGLTAGNFIYQALTARDYGCAIDRSFFQFVALLLVWMRMR